MSGFWILLTTFRAICTVQLLRPWVTAQSLTNSKVYQPKKEISANIGDSATLQCCILERNFGLIVWFKQTDRKSPQAIVNFFKHSEETFYNGFQKSRYQIERSSNCFNMSILNVIKSDESMYYCAIVHSYFAFGDGTYLQIKGQNGSSTSEKSQPALHSSSVVCEATLHGNNTNINKNETTVLGLGIALGFCIVLNICLMYFILSTRKNKICTLNASVEHCPETRQESEAETPNYAALQFSKTKAKAEKRKNGSSNECVYSDVKYSCKKNNS